MPRPKNPIPGKSVSVRLPSTVFTALDEYRWSARFDSVADVVRAAVDDYIEKHGISVS